MKLFIPRIWTRLELTSTWTFRLIPEYRNIDSLERLGYRAISVSKENWRVSDSIRLYDTKNYSIFILKDCPKFEEILKSTKLLFVTHSDIFHYIIWENFLDVELPKWTNLNVDRIYIKKWSYSDYDSITFWASHPSFWKKKLRFWARLEDVNNMEVDILETPSK